MSSKVDETDEEFDARYEAYFNRPDIDGWEVRKAMHDLTGMDLVPEPKIVAAALRACRRINDYALTTRFLEVIKNKCGPKEKEIWPYMIQVRNFRNPETFAALISIHQLIKHALSQLFGCILVFHAAK